MTNDEKLNYIIEMHKLCIKYKLDNLSNHEQERMASEFSKEFNNKILPLQPLRLYKYREVNEYNLDSLENDYVWFSEPKSFDDSIDSTINIDPEEEVDYLMRNNGEMMYEYNLEFVKSLFDSIGMDIPNSELREYLDCFDDGILNIESAKKYIETKVSDPKQQEKMLAEVVAVTDKGVPEDIAEATKGFLNVFMDTNEKIQSEIVTYCLAEESDNDLLWGTYAKSCTGFCVEYTIPINGGFFESFYRTNLYPIYYGQKERINIFDIFKKSIFNKNKNDVNGILAEDYRKMFISSYTKEMKWCAQNEWRINIPKLFDENNKQPFPYATAVILGEKMDLNNQKSIIDICRKKGIPVFKRKYNSSRSKIIVEKIIE